MIEVQRDTVERRVYITYSGLDLKRNTTALDLSKFGKLRTQRFFYIPRDSVRIEYRDTGSMRTEYIVLSRKAYHTKMKDIHIWHSGVDSQIDSVQFHYTNQTITEQWIRKEWKHEVRIFASFGYCERMRAPVGLDYCEGMRAPVGLDYTYYPKRWIGVGGRLEHDFLLQKTSILATANFRFGW